MSVRRPLCKPPPALELRAGDHGGVALDEVSRCTQVQHSYGVSLNCPPPLSLCCRGPRYSGPESSRSASPCWRSSLSSSPPSSAASSSKPMGFVWVGPRRCSGSPSVAFRVLCRRVSSPSSPQESQWSSAAPETTGKPSPPHHRDGRYYALYTGVPRQEVEISRTEYEALIKIDQRTLFAVTGLLSAGGSTTRAGHRAAPGGARR